MTPRSNEYLIVVLIRSIFHIVCALAVAYTGIKSYKHFKRNIKDHKAMWYFALITFLCVTLSFVTASIFAPIATYYHTINLCPTFYIIEATLSCIFKINLYLFFLQRIHNTFQYSIHQIPPIFINTLRIITILYWSTVTVIQVWFGFCLCLFSRTLSDTKY